MKGFSRFPALAGAAVALGLLGGPAARVEVPDPDHGHRQRPGRRPGSSVAGSDVTLTATYAPAPCAPRRCPTSPIPGRSASPTTGPPRATRRGPELQPHHTGRRRRLPRPPGADDRRLRRAGHLGFFGAGPPPLFLSSSRAASRRPGRSTRRALYHIGVEVDTATSTIDIVTGPHQPGPRPGHGRRRLPGGARAGDAFVLDGPRRRPLPATGPPAPATAPPASSRLSPRRLPWPAPAAPPSSTCAAPVLAGPAPTEANSWHSAGG